MIVLRSGPDWCLSQEKEKRDYIELFQEIAKPHGSNAKWLPVTGTLISADHSEQFQDYPYERWRDQAQALFQKIQQ